MRLTFWDKVVREAAYAKYPALSRRAVLEAVDGFLNQLGTPLSRRYMTEADLLNLDASPR